MKYQHPQTVIVLLTAFLMTGCQHIQLARSPIPITLTPTQSADTAPTDNQQKTAPSQADLSDEIPSKTTPQTPKKKRFFLLENWF